MNEDTDGTIVPLIHNNYTPISEKSSRQFYEDPEKIVTYIISASIALISSLSGYESVADALKAGQIRYDPHLPDRGQASLRGAILLGPEPFAGSDDGVLVAVAATLVHEQFHTRQNPLHKTASFWRGVYSHTHPMRRYEWPAYRAQAAFLQTLANARPDLASAALAEREAALASFRAVYGDFPGEIAE